MNRLMLATCVAATSLALVAPATAQTTSAEWRASLSRGELMESYEAGEIRSVDFLNRHVGWAVGYSRTATLIFRTDDGGRSWDRLPLFDGQRHVPQFNAVRFADPNNGWIVGRNHVLRTRDRGVTWEPLEVPAPGSGIAANTLLALGPDAVMIGSNSSNGDQIRVTQDGGRTWRVSSVTGHGNDDVVSLAFAPPDRYFAVTASAYRNRGGLYRSRDGGRSWEPVVEGQQPLRALAFHGERGVAAGDGVAYWTADGGETWQRGIIPGRRHAVRFLDADHVIAAGDDPGIVVSEDGGRSWRAANSPNPRGQLVDIALVDPGWFFVAGGYGANALFQYVDPAYRAPLAEARIPLPHHVRLPGGEVLPRGVYDITLSHRGEEHVLEWQRVGSADAAEPVDDPALVPECADPCGGSFPIDLDYAVENVLPDEARLTGRPLSLEPTVSGVAIVVDVVLAPPAWLRLGLAALGAPAETDVEAAAIRDAATGGAEQTRGLAGRLRRAAAGDVRGAVQGAPVNPQAAVERMDGGVAATPAVYRIRIRHTLDLFTPDAAR